MEIPATNNLHLANMNRWNAAAQRWAECADSRGIWNKCHQDASLVFTEKLLQRFQNITNKKVCVLGSGDNQAVFALAGLGAQVTSVDISNEQLTIAAARAKSLNLDIEFIQNDVVDLKNIPTADFDMIFTGGHVAVWVNDLDKYYSEASRILKPEGLLIIEEYHPFRRIWKQGVQQLIVENPYWKRGPFKYYMNDDILYQSKGEFPSYEFHWTMADFVNAVIRGGCSIIEMDEYGKEVGDWEGRPVHGLLQHLLIIAQKI